MAAVKVVLPLPPAHRQGRIARLPEGAGQEPPLPSQQAHGLARVPALADGEAGDLINYRLGQILCRHSIDSQTHQALLLSL